MATTRPDAVLMLSGGLDSSVAAFLAAERYRPVLAITYDYGQRSRRRELGAGYALAQVLGVPHRTVELPFFRQIGGGPLTEPGADLPQPLVEDLDDPGRSAASAKAVWVPNRNGVMVAVGAAWAERLAADVLVVGFNAEEARTFPDNGEAFVERQNAALALSTANGVAVVAPTAAMTKAEIVAAARERDLPLELVWSCYEGDDAPCGRCESCRRFARALAAADALDWYRARGGRGGA